MEVRRSCLGSPVAREEFIEHARWSGERQEHESTQRSLQSPPGATPCGKPLVIIFDIADVAGIALQKDLRQHHDKHRHCGHTWRPHFVPLCLINSSIEK